MPKAKISKSKSMSATRSVSRVSREEPVSESIPSSSPQRMFSTKVLAIAVLLVILAVVLVKNKSMFIAATVNGKPLTRFELDGKMVSRYGTQTLDEMINEQLIMDEASKKGVKATDAEVNSKIDEIRARLGAQMKLEDALAQQGMTMSELKTQVQLQLLVDKLTAGAINVSDQEVADYISKNKDSMTATDEASLKTEALTTLTSTKKNEAFQKWFTDLKAKAKVSKFI